MDIFKGEDVLEFTKRFSDDSKCKEYLSHYKWSGGYKCLKCGHHGYQERKDFSRTCNKCSHTESASAHTMFHNQKFGLQKAFHIIFEMVNSSRGMSASQIAKRYSIARGTAHVFMHKVRVAMASTCSQAMEGKVVVDEYVVGGKEEGKVGRSYNSKKKKIAIAVELTGKNKVKRIYNQVLGDFSARSIGVLFDKHIDNRKAKVTTDEWKAYDRIAREKGYDITKLNSKENAGSAFFEIHTMIHQVKTTLRTIYAWVDKKYMQRYLDEVAFRINRSLYKDTIVDKMVQRMVSREKYTWNEIYVTN